MEEFLFVNIIVSALNIFIIVRVPCNDIGIINKCLDAGANGIICPLIRVREDCLKFLENCFYPPIGIRSFGPTISNIYDGEYFKTANKEILPFI